MEYRGMERERSADEQEALIELLLDWEDSQGMHPAKSLQEICGDRADLVPVLERYIAALDRFDRVLFDAPANGMPGDAHRVSIGTRNRLEIPGYQIVAEIGRGGMGIVYKAIQLSLDRAVAIKVINGTTVGNAKLIKRLRREAAALRLLNHDHVIKVFDIVERHGDVCLILEYVDGKNLAERPAGSALPQLEAARIALTVAQTMADVHGAGVLHCDLKPANLLRHGNDRVKISDFGLARSLSVEFQVTLTHEAVGTPSYMAPEQTFGDTNRIGEQTDVYSIGATLYDLLTGRPPFVGSTAFDTLAQVQSGEPISPRFLVPRISRDLETICLKCLAKEPHQRYASAASLAADLNRFLTNQPILARPPNIVERLWRWSRRHPDRAGLIAAILIGVSLVTGMVTWGATRMNSVAKERDLQDQVVRTLSEKADAQEFYITSARITERRLHGQPGWSWENLHELNGVIPQRPQNDHDALLHLRSELVKTLLAFDLRKKCEVDAEFDAYTLEFSRDGKQLVVGANADEDGETVKIALVDTETWAVQRTLLFPASKEWVKERPDGVRSMVFSPDGGELFVGSRSGWIHVFDAKTCALVRQWKAHDHYVHRMRFSTDGTRLLSCSKDKSVKSWSLDGHLTALRFLALEPTDLAVMHDAPENPVVVVASNPPLLFNESDLTDVNLEKYDVNNFKSRGFDLATIYPNGGGWVREAHDWLQVVDSSHQAPLRYLFRQHKQRFHELHSLEISSSGRWLSATSSASTWFFDLTAGEQACELFDSRRGRVTGRFHPVKDLYVQTGDSNVSVFELTSQDFFRVGLVHPRHWSVATMNSQGDRLAGSYFDQSKGAQLFVSAPQSNWPMPRLARTGAEAITMRFSPDGSRLAIHSNRRRDLEGPDHQSLELIEVDGERAPELIVRNIFDVTLLKFSPDGQFLYTAGKARSDFPEAGAQSFGELRVIDLQSKQHRSLWANVESERTLRQSKILSLAVGPRYLTCTSNDQQIRVLNRLTGELVQQRILGADCDSHSLAPDESCLVVGTRQGDLMVLEIPTLRVLQTVHAHDNIIGSVTFAGSRTLVSGSRSGELKLWNVVGNQLVETLTIGPLSGAIQELDSSSDGRVVMVHVEEEGGIRMLHIDKLREQLSERGIDW